MSDNDWHQIDLFDEQAAHLARAGRAVAAFELDEARRELEACLERFPLDSDASRRLDAVTALLSRLATLEAETGDRLSALLRLADEGGKAERVGGYRRVAEEAERRSGSGAEVEGRPVGLLWLAAGDLGRAERSLREALRAAPDDARTFAYLGDVLFVRHDVPAARVSYLRAFLLDPAAIDLPHVRDREVALLPSVAENEYETDGDGLEWVAAVGTVEGVFPMWPDASTPTTPTTPGRAFYSLILQERAARSLKEKVPVRQKMKALCPLLFEAFLERVR
jgi:tetratricopeptide (TPR) repeat protein